MSQPVLQARGETIAADLLPDGVIRITQPGRDLRWETWPVAIQEDNEVDVGHVWLRTTRSLCEQYPGRFSARARVAVPDAGGLARVTLYGRQGRTVGEFTVELRLHRDPAGEAIDLSVSDLDASLPSLSYPPGFRHVDELLLPMGVGKRVRAPGGSDRKLYSFWSHLNLRMWGAFRLLPGSEEVAPGLLVEFARGHADAMLLVTQTYAAPMWLKSLGRWAEGTEPRRTVRFRLTGGGVVGLARTYRRALDERMPPVTLTQKLDRFPHLLSLLRGRHVSFMLGHTVRRDRQLDVLREPHGREGLQVALRYADVRRVLGELHEARLTHALAMIRGWIRGGYDESHPDIWPPDPAFGSVEELQELCEGRHMPPGVTVALHDNYQDIYLQSPSFPGGIVRNRAGQAMPGGYWAGGQAYILRARAGLAYLERNWQSIRTLGVRAMFPDTVSAAQLYESYEPDALQTRTDDEAAKLEQLRFLTERGVLTGSEESAEFVLPEVAWLENRHRRVPGESVPLWPLVTHDLVANGRYGNAYYAPSPRPPCTTGESGSAPPWAVELLWGYFVLMSLGTWGDNPDAIVRAYRDTRHVDQHFARVATLPMTDYRRLTPDGQVEQTVFGDQIAVTVNFGPEPFHSAAEGVSLPAGGYRIVG